MYSRENPSEEYKELIVEAYKDLHKKGNKQLTGDIMFQGITYNFLCYKRSNASCSKCRETEKYIRLWLW